MSSETTGKEIAKALAISRNVSEKVDPQALTNNINEIAQMLAEREIKLNAVQRKDLWECLERIRNDEEPTDTTIILPVGASKATRKGGSFGWFKNLIVIHSANLMIDIRNARLFDHAEQIVFDFARKTRKPMTDADIADFIKVTKAATQDMEKEQPK